MENIFAVNKPKGITSFDVVYKIRKKTGVKKVGHGGTLDPLATGVLVIAVGREATKQLDQYVKGEKEYIAIIKLGFTSTTDDDEGEKREINTEYIPSTEEIEKALKAFIGDVQQIPPIYSAIRINGKRAYKIARKSEKENSTTTAPKMEPREVIIKGIHLLSYDYPILKLKVTTGPGVYIRSLARDIGEKLKTGAYLTDLQRTRVGEFTIEKAKEIEDIKLE
jgi:tRNA pseudouridine55 synthase